MVGRGAAVPSRVCRISGDHAHFNFVARRAARVISISRLNFSHFPRWYDGSYYAASPSKNPTGPAAGTYRVLRGGSWSIYPRLLRVSFRDQYGPGIRLVDIGFRCVRDALP